ncbi:hypothetical protein HV819_05590 [Anaerococcus sp. AGMB00486]|uniref:Uncharacterized protein n=1 Tax=Anaerococcus faecalis TaxID=2742993 RepID=A0ABX2N9Y1_9FIRM|nr:MULTISPECIES: hypothetical protein [Anaerococcus]MDY3007326.1 hypothetical protein [Anaerococcus porci]NVF11455.1 hypothetical protein [Anaerococcus faecalis]
MILEKIKLCILNASAPLVHLQKKSGSSSKKIKNLVNSMVAEDKKL